LSKSEETADFKHRSLIEIISVFFLMVILDKIIIDSLPEASFFTYYSIMALDGALIYYLSLRYPSKLLSIDNLGRIFKYGLSLGAIIPAVMFLLYFLGMMSTPNDYSVFLNYGAFGRCLWIVNMVIITPIVEELLFRGSFYRILNIRYGIFWAALLSSLLFASVHKIGIAPFIIVFMKGLLFTYAYQKSGSVWTSIIVHSMNNVAAVLFLIYYLMGGGHP
jgi:membrane protease YdiL (CAAX protease family)